MRQRERVAELRRGLPQGAALQDYAFEEGPVNLDAGDTPIRTVRLSELFGAPNCWSCISLCSERRTPRRARCARSGSMVGMVSFIIWLRMSTLRSWPRPTWWRCEHMDARAGGTGLGY